MKTLWIMVGVPGSGKTWIAKNNLIDKNWKYISRDEIRFSLVNEDEDYFSKEDIVFNTFIKAIKTAFNEEGILNILADATHLNWASRRKLLHALGQDANKTVNIIPVVINTPLEEIMKNNDERIGRTCVPHSVIRRMYSQMTDPQTDPFNYTTIIHINNTRERNND